MTKLSVPLGRYVDPQALFLLPDLRSEIGAEVFRFEHLPDLDLGLVEWGSLEPIDCLLLRFHFPYPETGNQILRLGEGTVGNRPLGAGEFYARTRGAGLETLACKHNSGFYQLLIE